MKNTTRPSKVSQSLIPFQYESKDVRVIKDESGNPWWVAKDVCDILDIQQPTKAVSNLDDDEVNKSHLVDSAGKKQEMITISESGLYTLIIRSNKPEAKKFRKWVTSEVLPQIRKTGAYMPQESVDPSTHKFCHKCQRDLPRDMFGKKRTTRDGLQPYCKECTRVIAAMVRDRNRNRNKNAGESLPNVVRNYPARVPIDGRDIAKQVTESLAQTNVVYMEHSKDIGDMMADVMKKTAKEMAKDVLAVVEMYMKMEVKQPNDIPVPVDVRSIYDMLDKQRKAAEIIRAELYNIASAVTKSLRAISEKGDDRRKGMVDRRYPNS